MGSYFAASGGHFINHGAVEVAIKREAERARDGRGGHHEQVRVVAFLHEAIALGDSEFMLLVDDDESDAFEAEASLKQRVGADDERAFFKERLGRILARAGVQPHANAQRLQPFCEIAEMLFGEDFRGRHHQAVVAALQRAEQCQRGHDGFAGADIALQ